MAEGQGVKEFPNVNQKLAAPKKLSAFEREKQAAEVKRQRAEAEDAAALKAFQESFAGEDDDYDDEEDSGGRRGPHSSVHALDGRYGPRSGPGSLGAEPPPVLKRKRALDEAREAEYGRSDPYVRSTSSYPELRRFTDPTDRDEDQEQETPRPTVQLSDLPPLTAERDIEELLQAHFNVHTVHLFPRNDEDTRSCRAVVALESEVSMSDIDNAISALRGRYLGFGHELNITRHLSSAASFPDVSARGIRSSAQPYGAEKPPDRHTSVRNAPPPAEYRAFGPPESYESRSSHDVSATNAEAVVQVRPPQDISTVRAIYFLASRLLSEPEPERALELEAMLMAQPIVQQDERFAFLYDAKSPAGRFYRHLLWATHDPARLGSRSNRLECVDDGYPIGWALPREETPFSDLTSLSEAIDHNDYVSSDEESDEEEGERRFNQGRDADQMLAKREKRHLRPLAQARLVHMLSRLPRSNARLRTGDIARVTHFAMVHASYATEEIVEILLLNIIRPFSWTSAAKDKDDSDEADGGSDGESGYLLGDEPGQRESRDDDPSNANLIALYAVSDILSASSTAGARNAWKYRQLFETGFKTQRTFYRLGRLDKELRWGKMKAEQWKRKVGVLLGLWESWNIFSSDIQEELKRSFFEPETPWRERAAEQLEQRAKRGSSRATGSVQRAHQFRPPPTLTAGASDQLGANVTPENDADAEPVDGIDGEPMDDIDGEPMDDLDGEPMEEGGPQSTSPSQPENESSPVEKTADSAVGKEDPAFTAHALPKRRMRAEDMFADSDDE